MKRRSPSHSDSFILCAMLFPLLVAPPLLATNHSGNIYTQTWYAADNPHIMVGAATVVNGDTLTIEAGCTVLFNGNYTLTVQGALVADGDAADHITFSSNQATPTPGYWGSLYFNGPDGGCLLDYCDISYGGSSTAMIRLTNGGAGFTNCTVEYSGTGAFNLGSWGSPWISSCTIRNCGGIGIQCMDFSADPSVSNCVIQDNGGYAVSTLGGNVKNFTGTMTITGNNPDAFLVNTGTNDAITTGTWMNHGVPYVINGNQNVSNGQTLTLTAGDTLKFNGNYGLTVQGTLVADGDAANHITFTSNQATPTPGYWGTVYFSSPDAGCIMDYCDISYGGSANGMIRLGNGGATFTNCTVEYSGTGGFRLESWGGPAISSCVIRECGGIGIQCMDYSADPSVSNCVIQDNGGYAVSTLGGNVKNFTGAMTITGNNPDAILVNYGTNDAIGTGTWLNHGVPYIINGSQSVSNGQTLTLAPGDTLRFNGNYGFNVQGTLVADGDLANHITFTSNQVIPTPGYWGSLYFNAPDGGCLLDYCDISYGGSATATIRLNNGGCTFTNCAIEHSGTAGIYGEDWSHPVLTSCVVEDNAGAGVHMNGYGADAHLTGSTLQGNLYGFRGEQGSPFFYSGNRIMDNASYGFYLTGAVAPVFGDTLTEWNDIHGNGTFDFYNGTSNVYAYYVYWGTTDPSVISSRIWDDFDDPALGIVYFTHWLDETHENEQTLTTPVITSVAAASDTVHIV
ncbi:MAG: right-handed parallel beta-helix repeat-containing protein, partial [Candidatus Eisenbacteria bacterium]|nr:right-handed parallel beta-helix repeat-containing protein [Candidatus Eisenbacteria bacterium]